MIKAVVLDLDEPLLQSPDRRLPAASHPDLDDHLGIKLGKSYFPHMLKRAVRALDITRDMMTTNAEVLIASLSKDCNCDPETIERLLRTYYEASGHPRRAHSQFSQILKTLTNNFIQQNVSIAIASDTVYTESATRKWVHWAGLEEFVNEFAFFAHGQNMHFAKGHPAYYAELIARVGIEPDECLIIGDSQARNLAAAEAVGANTWHIQEFQALQKLLQHIQTDDWRNCYSPRPHCPKAVIPQFAGNLAALYGLLSEVQEHQWLQKPDPDEWSILQILCHLSETEILVHQKRMQTILEEDDPFIRALPPPGPDIPPCHDDGLKVMHQFRKKRLSTIEMLETLHPEDWRRPARHSIFGLTNLLEMAYFTAQHDRLHITQLCQTLGKCTEAA